MLRVLFATALLGLAAIPVSARADIYECKTKDGVHYTNRQDASRGCRLLVRGRRDIETSPKYAFRRLPSSKGKTADKMSEFDAHIREAARLYQLPEAFVRAVMHVESGFSPSVISHAGAQGLMQLMP
ncbi:MAG: lytic transglycosylase domain-containing protein, partial [Myxococcales bacterium]|nr:lytic transglycosylase domain-containing protein [Myxococcales bacterium]